jgi:3-deoxy-D-manno-octulosonic-acid transferase
MWETCKVWLGRYNIWDDRTALRLLSALLFPRNILPETVRHIVIYRVGNIGDTVVAIPAMAALREAFPQAHITLLTSTGQSAHCVFARRSEKHPWVTAVKIPSPGPRPGGFVG